MDNHHVQIAPSQISCGILQLYGLTADPKKMAYAIASYLYHPSRGRPAAMLIWSDIEREGSNGEELFHLFTSLCPLSGNFPWKTSAENPITTNYITIYCWIIPHEEFKEWYQQERIERAKL